MKTFWYFLLVALSFSVSNAKPAVVHGSDRVMPIAFKDYKSAKTIKDCLPEIVGLPEKDIEYKIMPWKRVIKQVELGHIDIIGPMGKDPLKESFIVFTEPLMNREMFLWYKNSNLVAKKNSWSRFEDLKSMTIAYVLGYYYGPEFEKFLHQSDVKKIEVVDVPHGIKVLEAGEADYFIASQIIMEEYIDKAGLRYDQFGHLAKAIVNIPFVLGISKKSPWANKIDEINKRIVKMRRKSEETTK